MPDLDELLARHEQGLLTAAEEAELLARLRDDPAARRALVLHARIGAILARTPAKAAPRHRPRRRRPRRRVVGWAIAASVALALGLGVIAVSRDRPADLPVPDGHPPVAVDPAPPWRIASCTGATTVTGPAGTQVAQPGGALVAGDVIDAAGMLGISGPARLDLAAGTRLRLADGERFELISGRLEIAADHRAPGSPLRFASAQATAEIIGTRFSLAVSDAATRLDVAEGAVRFADRQSGLVVRAGEAALAHAGLITAAPGAWPPAPDLPPGCRTLWRPDPRHADWYGRPEADAWCSRPSDNGDTREARALVRSPTEDPGWMVDAGSCLRFTYFATGFPAGSSLRVMLKRGDLTNYASDLAVGNGSWRTVTLRLGDGAFSYIKEPGRRLGAGERIRAAAWVGLNDLPMPARFWVRDVVAFTEGGR